MPDGTNARAGEILPAEVTTTASLLDVIKTVLTTPGSNVGALEHAVRLHDSIVDRQNKQELSRALMRAQAAVEPVRRDMYNPQTRSKYASYQSVNAALRPVFNQHGLGVSFDTHPPTPAEPVPDLSVRVLALLEHTSGASRLYKIDMPADGKGPKGNDVMNRTHATGAAISYGRRYLWLMIGDLPMDDDDGNSAAAGRPAGAKPNPDDPLSKLVTPEVAQKLKLRIVDDAAPLEKILAHFKVPNIEGMTLGQARQCWTMLDQRKAKAAQAQAQAQGQASGQAQGQASAQAPAQAQGNAPQANAARERQPGEDGDAYEPDTWAR